MSMIDPTQLAQLAFAFLLPHLDYIRGKVADGVLTESGKALVAVVKDRWLAKNEAATAAVAEVAKDPADVDNRELLLAFLRKAFKADADFAAEVARLLDGAGAEGAGLGLSQVGNGNKGAVVRGIRNTVTIS